MPRRRDGGNERLARKIQWTGDFRGQGPNFFVQNPPDGGPVPTGESRLERRGGKERGFFQQTVEANGFVHHDAHAFFERVWNRVFPLP
jgi:hypothetical protein